MIRYHKVIADGYLVSVGAGGYGGMEITEGEYNHLCELIANKPSAPEGKEYRINEQDEYVLVEVEPAPEPEPTPDEALTRYANELTGENDPDLVSASETLITKFTEV